MRRRILTLLVVLIGISCIGLVSLQYHWIRQNVEAEKVKFRLSVSQSMNKVISELELIELIKYFNNLREQPSVVSRLHSLNKQISSILENSSRQNQKKADSIKDTNTYSLSNKDFSSYAWLSLLASDDTVQLRNFLSIRDKQSELNETNELISKFVGNTLDHISYYPFEINIYIPLLDSLIAYSLENNGIHTQYSFGIYNTFSELFTYISNAEDTAFLEKSSYRYALFPDNKSNAENFLVIGFPEEASFIFSRVSYFLWTSIIFILVIFASFTFALTIIFRQRKLSEIKNDFINNMTHEIKTPIATISLATEALCDESIDQNREMQKTYINIIKDENKRLGLLVAQILEQAKQDNVHQSMSKENINVHTIIEECVKNMEFIVGQKGGKIQTQLNSKNPVIFGNKIHITNILLNLIDNANKYSPEHPNIQISTTDSMTGIEIRVKDNGVGINRKDHKKIFDKFYRVPTGNVHNVKGYGVGLSYVRYAVQSHGGSIRVESEPKKGATFIVFLPNKKA